jgi:hypothetical protein
MLLAWQPNSLASSLGVRPARTSSIICSRNCAGYGGLGVCGLDTLDSFCKNNKVSVKWGQLHVVSARDDGFGTYAAAQYTASRIPGAKFLGFNDGGHLLVGHDEAVQAEVVTLLKTSFP